MESLRNQTEVQGVEVRILALPTGQLLQIKYPILCNLIRLILLGCLPQMELVLAPTEFKKFKYRVKLRKPKKHTQFKLSHSLARQQQPNF